jgi:quinol monooxygenase YgiN
MFVHAVYFWLRPDLTAEEQAQFVAGLERLKTITSAEQCYVGVPAATDRPVIERSYTYALVLVFTDEAQHDAYQVDPVHQQFVAECKPLWASVRIFDSVG